jgi:hypothetical protein
MRLEFPMTPGQQQSGSLTLSNDSGARVRIRAQILDFMVDATTTPQFEGDLPSEAASSCRSWLSLNPMEIEATPRTQVPVRFTLRAPANVKEGSYHCAAGFVTLPSAEETKSSGIRTAVRVVAAFYVVIGHPSVDGAIKQVTLEPIKQEKPDAPAWQAVVVIGNRGRMHFRPIGTLAVLDGSDKAVETLDFQSLPVLPEREQRFLFPLHTDLQSGSYRLRVRVDLGTGEIQQAIIQVGTKSK